MAKRPPQPLDREKLLNVALRALGGRAHSSGELREKLRRRAQNDEDVDAVLAKLKEAGYLNDRHFAENYAAARLQDQGLGKMRVLRDLRQRRVAPKLAEQVTEQTYEKTNEADLIEEFLRRKYRGKAAGRVSQRRKESGRGVSPPALCGILSRAIDSRVETLCESAGSVWTRWNRKRSDLSDENRH